MEIEMKWYTLLWATFWAFLGLKLSGAVDWSWWCVTAPLWPIGLVTVGTALAAYKAYQYGKRMAKAQFHDIGAEFARLFHDDL